MLPAIVLPAWSVAYERLLNDPELIDEQKKLKHHKIGFALDGNEALIVFRPLFLPQLGNGKPIGILRTPIGKKLRMRVNSESLTVVDVLYGK